MQSSHPASCVFRATSPSSPKQTRRKNRRILEIGSRLALAIAILALAIAATAPNAGAQANVTGTWQTLPTQMPINPVHVSLMYNGKVLVVSGSGNYPPDTSYMAGVWDPATDTVTSMPITWDMFCNGMVDMPDGRELVMGGTLQYDPFYGQQRTSAFDPITGTFADQQNMADGRWYPTGLVLGDGRVMVFSGLGLTGNTNTTVEFYTLGKGWSQPYNAPWTPPLYPRMHLLPSGTVFYSGSTTSSAIFNPATETWTQNVASTQYASTRTYGSSVLLPLTPANNFNPQVMIFGGGSPATNTTEIINLGAAKPKWAYSTPMSQARIEMNATLLPSGQILVTGGSVNDEDATTESLNADIYNSTTGALSSGGANAFARLYHSNSLLLPDATVLLLGSNPTRGTYEPHMEIYTPAYLYNSSGQLAARPTISSVSSSVLGYNSAFTVTTPTPSSISTVVLMRAGSVTHAFDMDQRMVGLNFTVSGGVLNVTSPVNGNLAPPGYYLLFLVNSSGVPSVAQFVQLMTTPGTPPTGSITSPSGNVTMGAGQTVSFAGTGTAPGGSIASYDWVFPSGNPSSSSAASPGNVTFATAGTYIASLTVTDNSGRTDPNPPTVTVTVLPSFTLAASPSSQSVAAGAGTSYSVSLTSGTGFSGTVSFGASGLPSGATATFSPTSITTSGSTTMNVTTTSSVAAGTYPLTITGISNGVSVNTSATLVVTGGTSGNSINFVQSAYNDSQASANSVATTYSALQTPGDLNVVIIAWNDTVASIGDVTDTAGNVYTLASGPTKQGSNTTQAIYFAAGILADDDDTNTVTVSFTATSSYPDLRILEYSGAAQTNALDVAAGASGSSATATVSLATTNANDLIVAGDYIETSTSKAGSGFTARMITQPDSDIAEDGAVTTTGSHSATSTLTRSGWWVINAAAFKVASGPPDTQPPTAPTSLTATAISAAQINLAWNPSTDNVGVTAYLVEDCLGAGCTNFTQVATTLGTVTSIAFSALPPSTTYSYRVRATDAAGNLSPYSNVASATTQADTQPPTAPTNLTATAASSTQINLSWTASTDNVGVTGYKVEQCQGSGCSNFAQITTTPGTATTYSATGLTAATSYSYRVRATDAAGNLSGYSNTASTMTLATPPPGVAFVQGTNSTPLGNVASAAATFASAQTAGDLNVVVIGWNDTTATVKTVTDSKGNVYTLAVGPTQITGTATQSIYYAANIAAAAAKANAVTVTFNGSASYPDLRIMEYSGAPTASPIDAAAGATGTGTAMTASVTTGNANDLILGSNYVEHSTTGPGSGFTSRMITADADIVEDKNVTATGNYAATAPMSPSGWWLMQVVAIK